MFQTHGQTGVSSMRGPRTGWDWSTCFLKERLRDRAGLAWGLMEIISGDNSGTGPQYQ